MKKPNTQKPDKPLVEVRLKRDKKRSVTAMAELEYRKGLNFEEYQARLYRGCSQNDVLKEIPIALEITARAEDWQSLEAAIADDPDTVVDNLRLYVGAALQRLKRPENPRGKNAGTAILQSRMKKEAANLYALLQYYEDKQKPAFIQELQKAAGKRKYVPLGIVYDLMKKRYGKQLKDAFNGTGNALYKSSFYKIYVSTKPVFKFSGDPEIVLSRIRGMQLFKQLFASFKIKP